MIEPDRLSAFIASRICHDLVSPVSSIASALDFLDDPQGSEMREQAEALLRTGSENAAARLEFLRYAFGSMGLSDGTADIHEAKRITQRFVETHKPSLTWDVEVEDFSFAHARLLMNLVLVALDCLPRGGEIYAKVRNAPDGMLMAVSARGARAQLRSDARTALAGETPEDGWSAQTVQPYFTRLVAANLGSSVTATGDADAEEIVIRATGIRVRG